jgi:hypothetical protein
MAQLTRLHDYVNNTPSNAAHVKEDFDQLITESNAQDLKVEKIKLSADDTTAGYLLAKLIAGGNITITDNEDGTATIAASGELSIDHSIASNRDVADAHPMSSITGLVAALANPIPADFITLAMMKINSVGENQLVALGVTRGKIALKAVNTPQLEDNCVTAEKVAPATLTETQFAAAVTDKLTADRTRKITISTSDPSGGSSGDIWIKYS